MHSHLETELPDLSWQNGLAQRTRLAESIVVQAGALANSAFSQRNLQISLKGPQDFLTDTDMAIEHFLRNQISSSFPQDCLLGEELGGQLGQITWVIDPIDGTANFIRGIPHFCICLALVYQGKTVLGVIYQPQTKELYRATLGGGAYCNGRAIQVANTAEPTASSVELGWSNRVPRASYLSVLGELLAVGTNVRRAACGALGLAWVADGRSDAYLELHMNAWDCLAGMLLVREAGGYLGTDVHDFDLLRGGPVMAGNPFFATLIQRLAMDHV